MLTITINARSTYTYLHLYAKIPHETFHSPRAMHNIIKKHQYTGELTPEVHIFTVSPILTRTNAFEGGRFTVVMQRHIALQQAC